MALTPTGFMNRRHDLLSIFVPSAGAGVGIIWTIPANTVVQVIGVFLGSFTTGVAAGNRIVYCYVEEPIGPFSCLNSYSHYTQGPSLAWDYNFAVGVAPLDRTPAPDLLQQAPLACSYQLKTGDSFHIDVLNIGPLDNFVGGALIRYFAWLEQ